VRYSAIIDAVVDGCENIECQFYAVCEYDYTSGVPYCTCPSTCQQVSHLQHFSVPSFVRTLRTTDSIETLSFCIYVFAGIICSQCMSDKL